MQRKNSCFTQTFTTNELVSFYWENIFMQHRNNVLPLTKLLSIVNFKHCKELNTQDIQEEVLFLSLNSVAMLL